MGSVGKTTTYNSGDTVTLDNDITKGLSVSQFSDMNEGHNPMSPQDWIDDMGYDTVPTAENFKDFDEYSDAYSIDGDNTTANQIGNNYVTIYRAQSLDFEPSIPKGAWVTMNPNYAQEHADNALRGQRYVIVKAKVKASDVVWAGDSFQEWGYFPK